MNYRKALTEYAPKNLAEVVERQEILRLIDLHGDEILTRDCALAHITASAFVVNETATKILFAYHNIFDAWSWLGGHADGESDLQAVAARELQEETGITRFWPLTGQLDSVEILPVWLHEKRGQTVPSHLHLNCSYLFWAEENQPLRVAEGENRAVQWIPAAEMMAYSKEKEMEPTYSKLLVLAKSIIEEKKTS